MLASSAVEDEIFTFAGSQKRLTRYHQVDVIDRAKMTPEVNFLNETCTDFSSLLFSTLRVSAGILCEILSFSTQGEPQVRVAIRNVSSESAGSLSKVFLRAHQLANVE
jgi:hypothetical protein